MAGKTPKPKAAQTPDAEAPPASWPLHNFRLPDAEARALAAKLGSERLSRQRLVRTLVRGWLAGEVDFDRLAARLEEIDAAQD